MKRSRLALIALTSLAALSACSPAVSVTSSNTSLGETMNFFYNPLDISKGIGDPWLYQGPDGYYYYTHSAAGGIKLTKTASPTLLKEDDEDETRTKIIFRQKSIDRVEIWAPEVFYFNGYWYAYFTAAEDKTDALEKDTSRHSYGMKSKTADPFGEWETAVKIELPDDYRSIDADFVNYQGKQYIVYAGWPNKTNERYRQNLYINRLEDGNPLKVHSSETVRHLVSAPTNTWEIDGGTAQNEGPCFTTTPNGKGVLFYSGSYSGGDNYCIAYLSIGDGDPLEEASWQKCSTPLMQKDMAYSEIIAPGHNSIFKSPDGKEDWICYHAAKRSGSGWDRQIRLQKMSWDGDIPKVEKIAKASDPVSLPSGDQAVRHLYEAEKATLTEDCYIVDQTGFASNNNCVSISAEGSVTFQIGVPENGKYALGIRYSNRDSSETTIHCTVNGRVIEAYAPNTLYDDTYFVSWFFSDLYIKPSGLNVIEVKADSAIYLDCLMVDYLNHAQ